MMKENLIGPSHMAVIPEQILRSILGHRNIINYGPPLQVLIWSRSQFLEGVSTNQNMENVGAWQREREKNTGAVRNKSPKREGGG